MYTEKPQALSLSYDLEEEEEEEELEGITLRIGLFFDGTGNNSGNSAHTADCRLENVGHSEREIESILKQCTESGFGDFDGEAFGSAPDNSYGNAPSNVVHLHDLYPDHASDALLEGSGIGYVPVYLEGIGTTSDEGDSVIVGQGLGLGETGVVARVKEAPDLIKKRLNFFQQVNPDIPIRRIEFDIFGFSRGAAAARHCANELLKPGRGVFKELLQPGHFGLLTSFDPAVDVTINFIGLFDTVAAIFDLPELLDGNFGVHNDNNPGVNLYLPSNCARKVIQLQARDERRHNFALNSVLDDHQQIILPGVHSDIGGGYLPKARERVWLTKPIRFTVPANRPVEAQPAWAEARFRKLQLEGTMVAVDGKLNIKAWPIVPAPRGPQEPTSEDYFLTIELDRPVRGELSLIPLRVMRDLAVRHGVPFDVIADEDERFQLPKELKPIAERILDQTLGELEVSLDRDQENLLRSRYIHQSAHWIPSGPFLVSKPAESGQRNIYPNRPQKGYPQ
ncbi:T6SS phospholipase effector Tle1-like catalytic domain-containing protein [Pseudomonas sp. S2_E01]